jgi:predicted acylesterase/phospholipase RssA
MNSEKNSEKNSEENKINSLILSGGGHIGFCQIGSLYCLEEKQFILRKNIKNIFCTSAGSIVSIIYALNYKKDELYKYIIERPWDSVFEINLTQLLNFYTNKGLFGINFFENILNPLLQGKSLSTKITLKEFYEYSNINIYFHSVELNSFNEEVISHENYPDLSLVCAVYMSSAVPMVFTPCFYNNYCYVDGGILNNYPFSTFCDKIPNNENYGLGLRGKISNKKNKVQTIDSSNNILDLIQIYVGHIINKFRPKKSKKFLNEIEFNIGNLNSKDAIEVITSKEIRIKYLEEGYNKTLEFMKSR